ncbi:hypothetical protein VaNZ11_007426 [Volvox africanus]|uniref:HECT-type E3 ubiquitin transferase n=1 Tax=Volvox africanus TaxID=51714 RepID=A0ABQ5S454_9CHLO|nr:hypothetical protein VaNZ11_007426 [Volvox africanus]
MKFPCNASSQLLARPTACFVFDTSRSQFHSLASNIEYFFNMRGLGGATQKEQTRDELLEAVRAERVARSGAKQRARAAGVIQRIWRGHRARRQLRETLVSEWVASYGPMVGSPAARLSGREVADKLLPPLLFLLKPTVAAAAAAAAHSLPAVQPSPTTPGMAATGSSPGMAVWDGFAVSSAAAGMAVPLPPPGSPLSNMIRGSLALLLRTCSATDPRDSYLALGLMGEEPRRAAWREQAWRLLSTCCRLVGSPRRLDAAPPRHHQQQGDGQQSRGLAAATAPLAAAAPSGTAAVAAVAAVGSDLVIDAVAIRLAALLTDAASWKCLPATGSSSSSSSGALEASAAEHAAAHLRRRLAQHPHCLFAALARLLAARQQQQGNLTAEGVVAAPAVVGQQQQLSRLLGLVLAVLRPALDLDPDVNSRKAGSPVGAATVAAAPGALCGGGGGAGPPPPLFLGGYPECLSAFCRFVLVAPGLVGQVPQDMQVRLRSSGAFARLCRSVRQQLADRTVGDATAAACCLTNLLQMLLGPQMHSPGPAGQGAGAVGDGGGAPGVLSAPPDSLWGPGGEVAAELAATAAALMEHMARARLYGSPELAAAVSGLWPLAQRGLLVPLLVALESRSGGVESYSEMCCVAIELLPRLSAAFSDTGVRADVPGLLNALAFSPGVLPRMWRWLCFALRLPRECPAAASRGLDVAALAGGYAGLQPRSARVLGLFCRVYAQLLLVLDDGEFYELQQPLDLAAARAVGTSLNSLVFHTYLPKPHADGSRAVSAPGPGDADFALLIEWAPRLLRALYERDVRRPYCQSLLWLAPYREMFGSEDEQPGQAPPHHHRPDDDDPFASAASAPDPSDSRIGPFTAGTVLHALVYGGGGGVSAGGTGGADEEDEGDISAPGGSPALQTRAGEGCRPKSLASLLRVSPQAVPFSRRVDLLRALLAEDKRRGGWELPRHAGGLQPIKVTIRRGSLIEDAYAGLAHKGAELKARLQVVFVNEAGMTEAGLDFGGLQKELLERVVSAGLDANYGLFTSTPDGLVYPNPAAERLDGGLALLEFMGLMFGKALYEGILLPVPFAHFFVARLQGRQPLFDDLSSLDPELHKNLLMVKRYEGDVSDLCLTFSADTDFLGCPVHHELLPGRGDMPVTNESRLLYCHLLADWHLNGKLGAPTAAFARGLFSLIPQASLRLFNPREFNQLLSGATADRPGGGGAAPLDVGDMRRWTRYSGGYSADSATVKLFWRVVSELTPDQQSALLRFATSCSRPPLGGFRYLQPPLTVHKVECDAGMFAVIGGRDVDRLPSASTCYNMLKLPNYRRASTLKTKLLYSITSGAGFELS